MSIEVKNINSLEFTGTAHGAGRKKVLFTGGATALTQFAYGELQPGESVAQHTHPTMDEYFFFTAGEGTYIIGDERIDLRPGVSVKIPHGMPHELTATGNLQFLFLGIAVADF